MPEPSGRRPPADLARLIEDAITAAPTGSDPWPALERAHIAPPSQPWAWPHLASTPPCFASPRTNSTAARSPGR